MPLTNRCRVPLTIFLAIPLTMFAQAPCRTTHLTVFDANVAEFFEERTLDLQPGPNAIEWRSLMPQAYIRTVRVTTGDRVTVKRQDFTYDGPDVRNQKSPVLHLVLENAGTAGPRKVQIDYLAPGLSWKGDYALVLAAHGANDTPKEMQLDGWVTIQNDTGADICAASVDLVAGEVQLQIPGSRGPQSITVSAQTARIDTGAMEEGDSFAELKGMSVFSRIQLGRNVSLAANAAVSRFPLVRYLKLPVEQRHVFENEATAQTLGRGGFMLAPRGLDVRLVSRNQSELLPGGLVTIYSQDGETPQVVGQDQIPLTPVNADFSVGQGRSNLVQGTRRVIDRKTVPDASALHGSKLVTQVEVVIANHRSSETNAFVRESVEGYGREWSVIESTHPHNKLGDTRMEFRLPVPADGSVKLTYTVESR